MEICSIKQFFLNSDNRYISDYLDYLNGLLNDLKNSQTEAENLNLVEVVNNDLKPQILFLEHLILIIENSERELIINTIKKMSLDELDIFIKDSKMRINKENDEIKEKLKDLNKRLLFLVSKNDDFNALNGRKISFYEEKDVDYFFRYFLSKTDFIKFLIVDCDLEVLAKILGSEISDVDLIINRIISYRNVLEVVNDKAQALDEMANKLEVVFLEISPDIINNLIRNYKFSTNFYKNLPPQLQLELAEGDLDHNRKYHDLFDFYRYKFMQRDRIKLDFDTPEIKQLKASIENLEERLKQNDDALSELFLNPLIIVSQLIDKIMIKIPNRVNSQTDVIDLPKDDENAANYQSLCEVNSVVSKVDDERMEARIQELSRQISLIEKVLCDEKYDKDFDIVTKHEMFSSSHSSFVSYENIHYCLVEEKKKLSKIQLINDSVKRLNAIKDEIDAVIGETNLFKKLVNNHNKKLNKLYEKYKCEVADVYREMNVSTTYRQPNVEVFKKIFSGDSIYLEDMMDNFLYEELIERNISPQIISRINEIKAEIRVFNQREFSVKTRDDGVFEFEITEELDNLLVIQEKIVDLYKSILEEVENQAKMANAAISYDAYNVIAKLDINYSQFNRNYLFERHYWLSLEMEELLKEQEKEKYYVGDMLISKNDILEYFKLLEDFETIKIEDDAVKKSLL